MKYIVILFLSCAAACRNRDQYLLTVFEMPSRASRDSALSSQLWINAGKYCMEHGMTPGGNDTIRFTSHVYSAYPKDTAEYKATVLDSLAYDIKRNVYRIPGTNPSNATYYIPSERLFYVKSVFYNEEYEQVKTPLGRLYRVGSVPKWIKKF